MGGLCVYFLLRSLYCFSYYIEVKILVIILGEPRIRPAVLKIDLKLIKTLLKLNIKLTFLMFSSF